MGILNGSQTFYISGRQTQQTSVRGVIRNLGSVGGYPYNAFIVPKQIEVMSSNAADSNGLAGAWTVTITGMALIDGIVQYYNETVTMLGLAVVSTVQTQWVRVFSASVATSGTSNFSNPALAAPSGTITVRTVGGAQILLNITAGRSTSETAIFSTAERPAKLVSLTGGTDNGNGAIIEVRMRQANSNNTNYNNSFKMVSQFFMGIEFAGKWDLDLDIPPYSDLEIVGSHIGGGTSLLTVSGTIKVY